ncbi:MAG: GNAT family N-acetyltransferase [Candidatus Helarchaeota archaeon]|nr:GNAT family N-acetyltransferase [Candidatus Helarchaeota archaeon]
MNNILIRNALEKDLPFVENLINELIASLINKEGIKKDSAIINFKKILKDKNSYFLIAEIDKRVVGFINFIIRKTLLHSGLSGLIDELVVSQEYQNKGIGQYLIQEAIEQSKKLGCCEIEVSTEIENKKAIGFYKKFGFEEKGVLFEKDLL